MEGSRAGLLLGAGAYALWGLFPLYWPLLEPSGPVEILAHRIVWSLVVVAAAVLALRRGANLRALWRRRAAVRMLSLAAVILAVNWGVYIYGVNSEQVVETSLGYFINPLVTVLLGVLVLHERLRPAQWAAVAVGALSVAVLAVDYGRLPWIALTLAGTFGCYGLLKKQARAGALESLTVETAVLFLPALAFVLVLEITGRGTIAAGGASHATLLIGAGVVTALPLLLFGAATGRVPLTTIGLLQYLAPVLQLLIGVGLRHEPMPPSRLVGFVLVWVALGMLSVDGVRAGRRRRRLRAAEPIPVGEVV